MENKYLKRFRYLLSKERTRYLLFLIVSMITLFILIVAQSIALFVYGIYEYAGILLEVYTFILVVRIVTYNGLKHKKFYARDIKIRYIICALLLLLMCILMPGFYVSLFEKKQNPALPLWIIIVQLLVSLSLLFFNFKKYRKERVKFNEYYILYYIISITSKVIAIVLALNAIINMIFPKLYWLLLQQGAAITLVSLVTVVYIVIRSSRVKDITFNPSDNSDLTHEKISVFLYEYKEIVDLMNSTIVEEKKLSFNHLKRLSKKRYVHLNAYYYKNEFIGICYFVKKNQNVYIYYLAIKPEFQNKGFGTMIIKHLNPNWNNIYVNTLEINERINFLKNINFIDSNYLLEKDNIYYSIYSSKLFKENDYKKCLKLLFSSISPKIIKK